MALLTMIMRKMANNRWLQLNLWFGLTVCVALFSSMPLYSEAILKRTLVKELQQLQRTDNVYPGRFDIIAPVERIADQKRLMRTVSAFDEQVHAFPQRVGLPEQSGYTARATARMRVYGADASADEIEASNAEADFRAVRGIDRHIRLLDGRMPADAPEGGVYEALVTQSMLIQLKRGLGEEITGVYRRTGQKYRIVPVGIIAPQRPEEAERFTPYPVNQHEASFYIPFERFERDFTLGGGHRLSVLEYASAVDYERLGPSGALLLAAEAERLRQTMTDYFSFSAKLTFPALETIGSYAATKGRLDMTMLALYAPVMLVLAFYLYMTSSLIVSRQRNEIAVLRSRGASRLQIMTAYTAEGLLLGLAAMAAGPPLGVMFTRVLGASSGFMTFVNRSALEVELTRGVYGYAGAAVLGAVILTLIPAFMATRASIVSHKQQSARLDKLSFWHKAGMDFILIALGVYLLIGFRRQASEMRELNLEAGSLQVDPLLFLMPALFSLGLGLLFLRIYPWLIRLLYAVGRKWWPPALYSTLVTISRSSGSYLTIKVFLVMTAATGLFSANAARTINDNLDGKIQYAHGADVRVTTYWENDAPVPLVFGEPPPPKADGSPIKYIEPSFVPFTALEAVETATKVFVKEGITAGSERGTAAATLYGIETYKFGLTAWMKRGLMEHHLNDYLNVLAANPNAALISRSVAEEHGLKTGDAIRVSWDKYAPATLTVFGIVDYWPGWNPLPQPGVRERPALVVAQLSTIRNRIASEPYEVWMKLKDGATSASLYDELQAKQLRVTSLRDMNQELIKSSIDPFRMAINGVMTLGFVVAMLISFCGFLIFWLLSLSGRTLQFGVLRAMGIPFSQVIGMLVSEQLLTSAAAVVLGVITGNIVSELFVPLFELSFSPHEQVPPFAIVYNPDDYRQLYAMVTFMLAVGLLVLGFRLARTRISQALKLGEE